MPEIELTPEEYAALAGMDGSMMQPRPSPEIEAKLRHLGLIARNSMSGLPGRTAKGDTLVKAVGSRG